MERAYVIRNFRIFNRWGKSVYTASHTLKAEWDGTMSNGQPAETGTYSYFMEIRFLDGKEVKMKGDITLIR